MKYELLLLLPNGENHAIDVDADHVARDGQNLSFYSLDRDQECELTPAIKGYTLIAGKKAYETTAIGIGAGTSFVLNVIDDNSPSRKSEVYSGLPDSEQH